MQEKGFLLFGVVHLLRMSVPDTFRNCRANAFALALAAVRRLNTFGRDLGQRLAQCVDHGLQLVDACSGHFNLLS